MNKWWFIVLAACATKAHEEERPPPKQVDLSALPDRPPEEEKKPEVKFKKKPIVVELTLKQKKGQKLKPFRGKYRLVNASGDTVGEEEALGGGEPGVFIVTPGRYRLVIPGTKFQKELTLVGDDSSEKTKVSVVVTR